MSVLPWNVNVLDCYSLYYSGSTRLLCSPLSVSFSKPSWQKGWKKIAKSMIYIVQRNIFKCWPLIFFSFPSWHKTKGLVYGQRKTTNRNLRLRLVCPSLCCLSVHDHDFSQVVCQYLKGSLRCDKSLGDVWSVLGSETPLFSKLNVRPIS